MSHYKKLAGQTAIYGISSIVGRFLNYLLVPLYTRVFHPAEYGVVTQLYAYVAFINVLFTYGLDTSFFRFFQSENGNPKVYSTSLISILISSASFALLIILFADPLASVMLRNTVSGSTYIKLFAAIMACEAITAIPFAKLRQEGKAKRFAMLRVVNIILNVALNLFFLMLCPALLKSGHAWVSYFYNPEFGIGYVFVCNLAASALTLLMLAPEITAIREKFDPALWKQMFVYAFPLMIAYLGSMVNETFDRVLIPVLIKDRADAFTQLGIYGACYKLSIIMTLFVQTFRYGAEPFFFNHSTKENPQLVYAQVMKWFVIICAIIFLGVMLYIDKVQIFIGKDYRSGLKVVPILLLANLCVGVSYNLSIWYKLTTKTRWGAWLAVFGAVITLIFNFLLIPVMGYMGAAWTTLICYAAIMIASYFIGQKHYYVPYDVKSFFFYLTFAIGTWVLSLLIRNYFNLSQNMVYAVNTIILFMFLGAAYLNERKKISYLRQS